MNRKNAIKFGFGLFVSGSAMYFLYKHYCRKNINVSKDSSNSLQKPHPIRRQRNLQSEITKHLIHDVAGIILDYSSVCEQCDDLANDFHDNDIERCVHDEIVACEACRVCIYKCNNAFTQLCRSVMTKECCLYTMNGILVLNRYMCKIDAAKVLTEYYH